MPIYEYRCDQGHTFEVMQRMTDDPVTACSTCEAPVQRVFHPVAVHFKGSGFYNTDYGKKGRGESTDSEPGKDSGGESKKSGDASGDAKGQSADKSSSGSSGSGDKAKATSSSGSSSSGD